MITRRDFISSAAAASLLPSFGKSTTPYDYEVEYIESTGTQYIDTGIELIESTDVTGGKIGCAVLAKTGRAYSTTRKISESYIRAVGFFPNTTSVRFAVFYVGGTAGYSSYGISNIGELIEHEVNWSAGEWIAKNQQGNFAPRNTDNTSIYLFATHGLTEYYSVMVGEFWLKRNGQLIIDLIPVVKGGKGMMYDKVSGILFENRGAGEFITGPRKGVEMSPVAMGEAKFSARSYVQDGLIVMLDAKSGVGLKDFVSGRDLNVVGSVELEEDCYYFSNPQSYAFFNMTDEDVALFSSASTIEVCYTPIEYGGASFNGISGIGDLEILTQSSGNIYLSKYFFGTSRVGYGSAICATITADSSEARIFKDGIFMTGKSGQYPVINKATGFKFNRRENYTIYGLNGLKIHSCRFYNRPLSASEIASNYAIDKARFNLQ